MRRWLNQINEQLNIAAVAFDSQDGMVVTDAQQVILRTNRAFTDITGYSMEEVIGRTPKMLSSGLHDKAFYSDMWQSIRRTGTWHGEIYNRRKDGEVFPERLSISAVRGHSGQITHYVGVLVDETMHQLAFYDSLTCLPNRRLLSDRIGQALLASKRSGSYGAVMFLDLDDFKSLNDSHGHEAGDLLLAEAAGRISDCLREMDTVARWGGDEFVVVLRELTATQAESTRQAGIIAEKIRAALARSYVMTIQSGNDTKETITHRCSSSIGVALFNGHAQTADDILKQADIAMYQAKGIERNSVRFYEAHA
jgi:diguanylate cyclase (GGDEF)-like protein/PAS domain S-box-containing protein